MDPDDPQKTKLTTDGKQSAGHSYSTRSKAKRTSHSDDDSSGSQAQEPPLKRKTRPGAKQAHESAGINNDNANPDLNDVVPNALDEYAPAKVALQNDLVLESLLKYMNRSDLLSCRVVNKQWQIEATKELRRRKLVIRFFCQSPESHISRTIAFQNICRRLSECRTPSLFSSLQVETVSGNDLGPAGVASFFTTVGNQLKQLTLHLNYSMNRYYFESSSVMTHLQNLLFRQSPNLDFLEINFDFPSYWEAELQTLDIFGQNQNGNNESLLLPNLKTFIVRGSPASKFLADVIKAAVNLRSFGGDWSACSQYLMGAEGGAKIQLLKSLSFDHGVHCRGEWNQLTLELVEIFVTEQKENLQLETFECLFDFYTVEAPIALRTIYLINRILDCSSGSLKKLIIEPAGLNVDRLIIPRLPQLQEMCFDCYRISLDGFFGGSFFPRGFNINHSFPNVSTIVLLRCSSLVFRVCVRTMTDEITEAAPSIRSIFVIDAYEDSSSVPPLASDFHDIFPNLVSFSSVGKYKSYKI